MPTCPDCGSIIMQGDPYCSHCGAHLSWQEDSSSVSPPQMPDFNDNIDDLMERERKHQEMLKKVEDYYKVKLEDLDVKDCYTEYIFLRKRPLYTLKIVATDQFGGGVIGIKEEETRVDFTKLLENRKYKELVKDLNVRRISTSLRKDILRIFTEDKVYLLDTDNMKLIEMENPDELPP